MTLAKNSVSVFGTRVFRLGVSFGTGVLLARWLQPEGRGAFSLVTQLHQFAVAIGGMSVGYATIHFSGTGKYSTEDQVSNSFFSAGLFSLLMCLFIIAAQPLLNRFFPFDFSIMLAVMLLIPIAILDSYLRCVLQSKYKFAWINRLEVLQALLFGICIAICAVSFRPRLGYAIGAWGGALLLSFAVLVRMVRKVCSIRLRINRSMFKAHVAFGAKAHLSTVIGLLSLRFDQYILGALTNTSEVGKYAVAVNLAELLWFIPSSVSFVLLPMTSHDDIKDSIRQTKKACVVVLVISILTAASLALMAKPLILYGFGADYGDSANALLLLLPGMIAVSVTTITTPFFLGKLGKPHLGAIVAAVSLASNVALNFLLIPRYGLSGVSAASSISYILATVVNIALFYKYAKS